MSTCGAAQIFFILVCAVCVQVCNRKQDMFSRVMKTIILGPPGSGKGTISDRIIRDFRMQHLSSGDYLRSHISYNTDIGMAVKKYIDSGSLVPDSVMINLISSELETIGDDNWLLDGFPRTIAQAEALHERTPAHTVINLNVPFEVIIDRIKGRWLHEKSGRIYHTDFNPPTVPGRDDVTGEPLIQREDDKEETVRKRLEHYQNLTEPVLQYYRNLGLLQEFHGTKSNEIWPKIHEYLSTKVEPLQYTEYD